jgi:hypothetical protein
MMALRLGSPFSMKDRFVGLSVFAESRPRVLPAWKTTGETNMEIKITTA